MKRTGRSLVILTMAAWLAALTPALAAPSPVGDDPVRIGIGVGGDIIDVLSDDHDDDDGDRDHDGDHDGDGDGLLGLLLGHGDDDDDNDGLLEEVVEVVDRVLAVVFGGDDDDSVNSSPPAPAAALDLRPVAAPILPVAAVRPADDDGFEELLDFLEEVLLSEDLLEGVTDNDLLDDGVDEVLEAVAASVEGLVCTVSRLLVPPPAMTPPCL